MRRLLFCLLLPSIWGCSSGRDRKHKPLDADQMNQVDSSSVFSSSVTDWINSNLKTTNVALAVEERWQDDSLHQEPFELPQSFTKNYSTVLRWSPDSAQILDFGSYGAVTVKDKKGKITLEGREPDTEVALIDVKNKARTRLLYVGPSAKIIDGKWLNNDELMLLGTFESDNAVVDTLAWKIDYIGKQFILYNVRRTGNK